MDNYFDSELKNIEHELLQLKTVAQVSSVVVKTTAQTVSVNIPLHIENTYCYGDVTYEITTDVDAIIMVTLDWYHQDVSKEWQIERTSRYVQFHRGENSSNGKLHINVFAYGTDWSEDGTDDLSKLRNGQSVTISVNMTVRATSGFSIRKL